MTALTADKKPLTKWTGRLLDAMPMAAAARLYSQALIAVDTAGNANPAADTVGFRVVGWAPASVDNTDGDAGDLKTQALTGVTFLANDGGNPVTAAMRGRLCYVKDDTTVQATNVNGIVAGIVEAVNSAGVWVYVAPEVAEGTVYPTWQETKTSGALTLGAATSNLSITGTVAFSLANGDYVGQRKRVVCTAVSDTPIGTLTIATGYGSVSNKTYVFTAVGQALELEWYATGWRVMSKVRTGEQLVVVGTTVLTGYEMAARYNLSVTGTVASTGAQGIPNGAVAGEQIDVQATVNTGGSDEGEIAITAVDLDNEAATKIDAVNGTTAHHARFIWDGAAWQTVSITGVVLA